MSVDSRLFITLSFIITSYMSMLFFFFNDTATTEIYTLSLHDALPISGGECLDHYKDTLKPSHIVTSRTDAERSEEHTSELQSHSDLVCRLLLEKKKAYNQINIKIDASNVAGAEDELLLPDDIFRHLPV